MRPIRFAVAAALALLGPVAVVGSSSAAGGSSAEHDGSGGAAPAAMADEPVPEIGTPAPDIVITFESDSAGTKPNGFASASAPAITFTDTVGAGLEIGDFAGQGEGSRSLLVRTDFDNGGVSITLPKPTTRISMRFGNDDPNFSNPGDQAVLQAFRGTTLVGTARVTMNRNDLMDQSIAFAAGPLFNRVVFRFDVDPAKGLQEIIDHIVIAPLCTVAGTEAGETLTGTAGRDVICGAGGNDTVSGLGGNDVISAGSGNDTVRGGPGDDFVTGDAGADSIHGDDGADHLEGNDGADQVFGDVGNDQVVGGAGTDACNGGMGTDTAASCETTTGVP